MIVALLFAVACSEEQDSDVVIDTAPAECGPGVYYIAFSEPDCQGAAYVEGPGGQVVLVASIYSVPGQWCMPFEGQLVDAIPVCP